MRTRGRSFRPPSRTPRLIYRSALDGLRGLRQRQTFGDSDLKGRDGIAGGEGLEDLISVFARPELVLSGLYLHGRTLDVGLEPEEGRAAYHAGLLKLVGDTGERVSLLDHNCYGGFVPAKHCARE